MAPAPAAAPRTLPRAINFVSSVSGADKVFRTSLYTLKVVDQLLTRKYGDGTLLAKRIRNLTGPIGDTRMILRLFGVLPSIEDVLTNGETDPFLRRLTEIQAWSMLIYYPMDNIYWLALHEIIPLSDFVRDESSRYSCQAWLLYIVLDLLAYAYKYQGNLARAAELAAARTEASDAELATLAQQRSDMRLRSIAALADLLLAVHWSVRVSPVSPLAVALAGTVSSTIGFHMKWRSTTA